MLFNYFTFIIHLYIVLIYKDNSYFRSSKSIYSGTGGAGADSPKDLDEVCSEDKDKVAFCEIQ